MHPPALRTHPLPEPAADEISIVTAFFDIGRGAWTADKDLPGHLHRPVDTYFEWFANLATLDNEMAIYTAEEFVPKIAALRAGKEHKTKIIPLPYEQLYAERREAISRIQKDERFLARINPAQIRNPEYWSADYVLINSLKSVFASHAVQYNHVTNPVVAWMDFGYCRTADTLGGSAKWQYPFAGDKIHLFVSSTDYQGVPISHLVENNAAFVSGAAIVAGRDMWQHLVRLVHTALDDLIKDNMVDDDQTLLLMASLYEPALFELHKIPKNEWQPVLRLFNSNATGAPNLSDPAR